MQDLNCEQMRALPNVAERSWVSGCNNHYKFVLSAGAKVEDPPVAETKSRLGGAKTPDDSALRDVGTGVTNNLPILSV